MVRGRIQGQTDLDKEAHPGLPDLFGRITFLDHGGTLSWVAANAPKPLAEIFKKATASATVLLHTLRLTTVSIRQRAIFYGTYCLSKFTYVASYACVTQKEINLMQVKVAKAVLRRHWIQARHLPGTLRALKIAPMQDPEIAFACAALGLLERRAAEEEDLCAFLQQRNIDYEGDRQLDTALTYLERYLPTLEPNDIRTIQQILATSAYANKKNTADPSVTQAAGKALSSTSKLP